MYFLNLHLILIQICIYVHQVTFLVWVRKINSYPVVRGNQKNHPGSKSVIKTSMPVGQPHKIKVRIQAYMYTACYCASSKDHLIFPHKLLQKASWTIDESLNHIHVKGIAQSTFRQPNSLACNLIFSCWLPWGSQQNCYS